MGAELTPIVPVDCCARAASARSEGKGGWEGSLLAEWLCKVLKAYCFPDLFQVQKSCWLLLPALPAAAEATVCVCGSERSVCVVVKSACVVRGMCVCVCVCVWQRQKCV